jgi:polysaccharide pyruvyl transferase WcaK-like protein
MRVHVAGTYGYGSFGDDWSLDVLKAVLEPVWHPLDLVREGVDAEPFSPTSQDATVLAGTGLLYTGLGRSDRALGHYLRFSRAMQLFGKKTLALALGVQGELDSEVIAPHLPAIEAMDLRTVRDAGSAQALREVGVQAPVLECADLTYLAPSHPHARWREDRAVPPTPRIGFAVSQSDCGVIYPRIDGFEEQVLHALYLLRETFNIRILSFTAVTRTGDSWLADSWARPAEKVWYEAHREEGLQGVIDAVRDLDVLVTSRLHGVVLAASLGIPFVAVGAPGEKVDRECRALGYPLFLPYTASGVEIATAAKDAWSERDAVGSLLKRSASQRKRLARRTFELAGEAIGPKPDAGAASFDRIAGQSPRRRLLIWAAASTFLGEIDRQLTRWGAFDALLSANSTIDHPAIESRFVVPQPGILNWDALPPDLRQRIARRYDAVLVCHADPQRTRISGPEGIALRATASDTGAWVFSLWTHVLNRLSVGPSVLDEVAVAVEAM